jgi:hypothetical protein
LPRRLTLAMLVALYLGLSIHSLLGKSVTVDEYAHLPAACAALRHGTLDLYGKNPPLVRYVLGTAALAAGAQVPVPQMPTLGAGWDPWVFGDAFVSANAGPAGLGRYPSVLQAARLSGVLLGALLILLVYHWGRRLHGTAGGLWAAFLLAVSPTFLAHARLATVDVGATLAITGALFLAWRALGRGGAVRWSLAGTALGVAVASKFTAWLLLPVLAVALMRNRRSAWRATPAARAVCVLAFLGCAWMVLQASYQFREPFSRLDGFRFHSRSAGVATSWMPGWTPVPLPAALVRGMDAQMLDLQDAEMPNYLNGRWSRRGWWYYYPEALALKTPLALWGLLFVGLWAAWRRRRPGRDAGEPGQGSEGHRCAQWLLGLWLGALLLSALLSHLDIGIRYLLPALPAGLLLLGGLLAPLRFHLRDLRLLRLRSADRPALVLALVLALLYAGAAVGAHPHYLPFFNRLAGGPAGGWRYLANSNSDWGQDLPLLKRWLESQGLSGQRIHLAYFGHMDPARYGIHYSLPPEEPRPGVHVVSLNLLLGLPYVAVENGRWVLLGEDLVQQQHRFAWLRERRPVARLGESLWVFRVGTE